ncbi:TraB/GumN family protein [Zavarzinia compransoris]|uniref:TraB/GumN family protein n=1 Tax=Zavarzinia marina TaxID=2911065 RepID=UPI001F367C2A|nr:TraB/GumN family protein [Zavarzinia marina]MCF4167225.1 TraB/GumN family protein [Zavarzinia marina]
MSLWSRAFKWAGLVLLPFFAFGGAASAEPALWVVRDGDSTVYLFGTMHAVSADFEWADPRVVRAFEQSDELWLEVDISNDFDFTVAILTYGVNYGASFVEELTDEEIELVDEAAERSDIPPVILRHLRPWAVSMLIDVNLIFGRGGETNAYPDNDLEIAASSVDKPVHYLETIGDQLRAFSEMDWDAELHMMRVRLHFVRDEEGSRLVAEKMANAWQGGDVEGIEAVIGDDFEPGSLNDRLFRQRNERWMAKIRDVLTGAGTSFIAVGAGHLVGPHNVLALLEAEGYHPERIHSEGADPR